MAGLPRKKAVFCASLADVRGMWFFLRRCGEEVVEKAMEHCITGDCKDPIAPAAPAQPAAEVAEPKPEGDGAAEGK